MNIIIRIKALYTTKLPDLATSVVGLPTPWDFGIKSADWSWALVSEAVCE